MTLGLLSLWTLGILYPASKGHWEAIGHGWSSKMTPEGSGSQLGQKVNTVGCITDTTLLSLPNGWPPPPPQNPLFHLVVSHSGPNLPFPRAARVTYRADTSFLGGTQPSDCLRKRTQDTVARHARWPVLFLPRSWPCFPNKAESQDIFLRVLMPEHTVLLAF